jgi:hypothetical protein
MGGGHFNSDQHGAVGILYVAGNSAAGLRHGSEGEKADETDHPRNSFAERWKPKSGRIHHTVCSGLIMQDISSKYGVLSQSVSHIGE